MKKWLVAGTAFVVGVSVAVPLALAAGGGGGGRLDTQGFLYRTSSLSNASKSYQDVVDLSGSLCTLDEVAATISGNAAGAPFALRILMDGGPTMAPGVAYVYPPAGGSSATFSATFAIMTGTFEGSDLHGFEVQWRSLNGQSSTLQRVLANYQFQDGDQQKCGG